MSVFLSLLAFILIMVGILVQIGSYTAETKFAVTWTTAISAVVLIIFAAKVYFA